MPKSLILTAPQAMTAPLAGTPKLRVPGMVATLTSDTFSGGDKAALQARNSDALLGGASLPYEITSPELWAIKSGRLTRGSGAAAGVALVQLPANRSKDVTISCKVVAMPTSSTAGAYLIIRRSSIDNPQAQARLAVESTGVRFHLTSRGNASTPGGLTPVSTGDTVGMREYDGLVEILVNGQVITSHQMPQGSFTGDFAGFASVSANTGPWAFDDLLITETIH